MPRPRRLPGAEKYQIQEEVRPEFKDSDPVVAKANAEVSLVRLLNDHYGMHVPPDAQGWKATCPFSREHDDGGIDRQFRVYSDTNTAHCFALHGTLDPVRLWKMNHFTSSPREAAEEILTLYGIEFRARPHWERMRDLRAPKDVPQFDPDIVTQALNLFLEAQPGYEEVQYDETVLRSVNSVLAEVRTVCAEDQTPEEVEEWLRSARSELARTISRCWSSG